ncbi:MAG: phosphohistidine phosphatase SixA [Gammaproteobacteria bacterium]|uniref:Phosphohistidine phosphatase n=1 Tax=Tolumonas osonensis TaxID=675874 RepID=A0A841GJ94_9GAMM|nr:phosphohistidine phosphatase SixA [Tolumonas osonensis]MBB6055395.1 phosphohistidine phosphatase [Tolumonas osonensis]NCB60945.1 phosphohistidine phosphatase SixA [Gammaproteobacteria bacterium]
MKIIVMRHGEAAHEAGRDDLRPLTDKGRKQSVKMAEWVAAELPRLDRVLVSPFLRAQQTWEAVRPYLPTPAQVEEIHDLVPYGRAEVVTDYLRALDDDYVLIISHLPLVGYIVNDLCANAVPPMFVTSGMAGVSLLDGKGSLEWLEGPHTLR